MTVIYSNINYVLTLNRVDEITMNCDCIDT